MSAKEMHARKGDLMRAVIELVQVASGNPDITPREVVKAVVDRFWQADAVVAGAELLEMKERFFLDYSTQGNQVEFGEALNALVAKALEAR